MYIKTGNDKANVSKSFNNLVNLDDEYMKVYCIILTIFKLEMFLK